MLQREDHPKPDTHPVPPGNYVIRLGNYVTVSPSRLGNCLIVHRGPAGRPAVWAGPPRHPDTLVVPAAWRRMEARQGPGPSGRRR